MATLVDPGSEIVPPGTVMNPTQDPPESVDDSSMATILRLQIQDVDELISNVAEAAGPDVRHALIAQKEGLQRRLDIITDRQVGVTLAEVAMSALTDDRQAEVDRQMAHNLARLPPSPPVTIEAASTSSSIKAPLRRRSPSPEPTPSAPTHPAETVQRATAASPPPVNVPEVPYRAGDGRPPPGIHTFTNFYHQNPEPMQVSSRKRAREEAEAEDGESEGEDREEPIRKLVKLVDGQPLARPSTPDPMPRPGDHLWPDGLGSPLAKTTRPSTPDTMPRPGDYLWPDGPDSPLTGAPAAFQTYKEGDGQLPPGLPSLLASQSTPSSSSKRPRETEETETDDDENEHVRKQVKLSDVPDLTTLLSCISCGDELDSSKIAQMPCSHQYCAECLQQLVQNSLKDEALFPPKCCRQVFDMDDMRNFLTPELISSFHEKSVEYGTADRIYCSSATCSTFLYPANIDGNKSVCPVCFTTTCTVCKGEEHEGDCPEDSGIKEVLTLAEGKGWKRCDHCKAVIELGLGCNHITCRCKAQWCYVCKATWRTCDCPQWAEDNLLIRTDRLLADGFIGFDFLRRVPFDFVENAALARQHIEENHQCAHARCSRVKGARTCDECERNCKSYYFRCQQCHIGVCFACMKHRI